MKIEEKIHFDAKRADEVKQMLLYIDHLTSRNIDTGALREDNLIATLLAAMTLEGKIYTESFVREALAGNATPSTTEKEATFIRCYYDALQEVLGDEKEPAFDEARIVSLHSMLYANKSNTPSSTRKRWGIANLLDGNKPTLFSKTNNIVVNNEIRELVEWLWVRPERDKLHPLTVTAAFLYEFLAIHPFREGKGELLHLLSLLLMYRNGYRWIAGYSPIRMMATTPVAYHHTIKQGIQNRYTPQEDITEWVYYWISNVHKAAQHFSATFAPELTPASPSRSSYLNMRQRRILAFIEKKQPVKIGDIVAYLRKESINTVKKDLLRMREAGYISTEGVLKGTVYYKN